MNVLAVTDDLIFSSKIEAAAASASAVLRLVSAASRLTAALAGDFALAIVDLNLSQGNAIEVVTVIRRQWPQLPILGYCSHTQLELQQQAKAAGCTQVVARSAFVHFLPEYLTGKQSLINQ